jgi:hypothetical protein
VTFLTMAQGVTADLDALKRARVAERMARIQPPPLMMVKPSAEPLNMAKIKPGDVIVVDRCDDLCVIQTGEPELGCVAGWISDEEER